MPAELPPVPVKVQVVRHQPHLAVEEVVGTVRARLRALVEAKVSGRILDYTAVPGASVQNGEVLAKLDLQEIRSRLDQARAMQEQARRDFERQQQLIASNATSKQDFDSAQARVRITTATVAEVETMLSYSQVTAPFDGVITRKLADVGDLAMPGKPLLEIEVPTALRFEADLPESIVDRVKIGDKLPVRLGTILEGTVSEISPIADPVSRTFLVKLDLPAAQGIRTGQFGRVSVPVANTQVLAVPAAAVVKRGQLEIVFVVSEGHVVLRLVKTGRLLGEWAEILSGLESGEAVIVDGSTGLVDGTLVTLKP